MHRGFNIGDEYLGLNDKFGYWRDTHLKVRGDGVDALQLSFIHDWNSQAKREQLEYNDKYFPDNAKIFVTNIKSTYITHLTVNNYNLTMVTVIYSKVYEWNFSLEKCFNLPTKLLKLLEIRFMNCLRTDCII